MGPRDQKLTPRSSTQHPTRCQNRHWAAEVTKVGGGAAKDTLEDYYTFFKIDFFKLQIIIVYLAQQ